MELKNFVKKYWYIVIGVERKLKVPAIYLLAHAIMETEEGECKALNMSYGFEVIIPVKINRLKQFYIDIKYLFNKKEKVVIKEVFVPEEHIDDYVIHFFENVSYHAKFEYLQSEDRFAKYIWQGKELEDIYIKKFKDTVTSIRKAMQDNKHL